MNDRLKKIIDFMKENINADDYTLKLNLTDDRHTRFAQNAITQHMSGMKVDVSYKCVINKKTGKASTCQLDEGNLLAIIRNAEEIAHNNVPDDDFEESLEKSDYERINNFSQETADFSIPDTIKKISSCVDYAKSEKADLSGIFSKKIIETILSTGKGFLGYDKLTSADFSMTMRKDHRETKVSEGNKNVNKISFHNLKSELKNQFDGIKELKVMEPESIPVILKPRAVLQLYFYLLWLFDRQAADEGLTPFTNCLEKKLLSDRLSLKSTLKDEDLICSPFSSNSIHRDIEWVEKGVIKNMPVSRTWAKKQGLEPSNFFNLIMQGEGISEEEMMKTVPRGLLINNLWYIRLNDRKTADVTGMTRDGVVYFEDGEEKYGVNNFRFNEKLVELSNRILATGKVVQQNSHHKVPSILFENFTFVDKTNF